MKNTSQSSLVERLGVTREQIIGIHGEMEAGVDYVEKKNGAVEYSPAGVTKVEALLQVAPPPPAEIPPEKKTAPAASGPQTWTAKVVRQRPPGLVTAMIGDLNVTVRVHADKCRRLAAGDELEVVHFHAAQYSVHRYPRRLGGGAS